MGYYRAAEGDYAVLSARSRMALDAYAAGVNAWIGEGHTLPPEFLLLGAKPEPWKPIDSLVWEKMMSWDLGGDYDMELLRLQLGQALGPERAAQLLPPYPEDALNILPQRGLLHRQCRSPAPRPQPPARLRPRRARDRQQ